jgi:hypothetical protein
MIAEMLGLTSQIADLVCSLVLVRWEGTNYQHASSKELNTQCTLETMWSDSIKRELHGKSFTASEHVIVIILDASSKCDALQKMNADLRSCLTSIWRQDARPRCVTDV